MNKISCLIFAGGLFVGSLNFVSAATNNQPPGQIVTEIPQLLAPGLINTGMATRDGFMVKYNVGLAKIALHCKGAPKCVPVVTRSARFF